MNIFFQISYVFNESYKIIKTNIEAIPTWIWHFYITRASDLCLDQISHIRGTNIVTLYFLDRDYVAPVLDIPALIRALQGTNVHTLYLFQNEFPNKKVPDLVQALQGTNIHNLHLRKNNISKIIHQEILKFNISIQLFFSPIPTNYFL